MKRLRRLGSSITAVLAGVACGWAGASAAAAPPGSDAQHDFVDLATVDPGLLRDDGQAIAHAARLGVDPFSRGARGLPVCPDVLQDIANCHTAVLTLGATFSNTGAGRFRVAESFIPTSNDPDRLCWIGRYQNRLNPTAADESFVITIWDESGAGFPDLNAGPIFTREFRQTGSPGVDLLEMDCLDGETCPGVSSPASGGHWVYSVQVNGGLPLQAAGCYWIEIACSGSSQVPHPDFPTGVLWGWVGSTAGTDVLSLQALDGNYSLHTRAANDRALCVSGGTSQFQGGCQMGPQPPICTNPSTNGIPYDGTNTSGARASWPGTNGAGVFTPFQRADSFAFDSPATVSNICFNGFWLGFNSTGGQVPVSIPSDPGFRVAYFTHNINDGIPGPPIPMAEFAPGDPGVSLVWDGNQNASITHPPVQFQADTCYWVSIGRVQSNPPAGQTAPMWHWRLTTGAGVPSADNRTSTRTVGTGAPAGWGVTIFRTAAPACDPVIANYVFLLDAGPTIVRSCRPPECAIQVPPGATANAEPNCALAGNLNGGCNLTTPAFTTLTCGETAVGSSSNLLTATCGNTRDTDWYHLTVTQETEVTITVTSEFSGFFGYGTLQPGVINPTGSCAEYGGAISPFVPIGSCQPAVITRTLQPGTWIIFAAANFGDIVQCNDNGNRYTISVLCSGGPMTDCNGNGINDADEIAGNPTLDCFDPSIIQSPHTTGGPDGIIDECQCPANWNRDAQVNSTDISSFITSWLASLSGSLLADINCSGSVNSTDISAYITIWLSAVNQTIPHDNCP